MRQLAGILIGLSFLLLFAGLTLVGCRPAAPPFECTDAIGCVEVAADDPIKIGVMQVLSGDLQIFGQSGLRSIELALDDRGRELLGHPIQLQSEDSLCSKEGGAFRAREIA